MVCATLRTCAHARLGGVRLHSAGVGGAGQECGEGDVSPIDPQPRTARAGRRSRRLLALGLVLLTATACSSEELPRFGMPEPATEESARIAHLWSGGWIAAWIVGAVVWGLIIWVVIFHRRKSTALPTQTRYNLPIEVLYIIAPFIIVVVFFYFTARDESKIVALPDNPDQTINVVGRQWSWTFNYVDGDVYEAGTPGEPPTLYLPKGQTVLFELTSRTPSTRSGFRASCSKWTSFPAG